MDTVAIVSPYNASTEARRTRNVEYARSAAWDALSRGEAPIAIHLVLGDPREEESPEARTLALQASKAILQHVQKVVVYTDLGYSPGMRYEIEEAKRMHKDVEFRSLET